MYHNVCGTGLVICKSWFPLPVIGVSNKPRIGPVQILGQRFGLKDDSFGLERGHAGEQLCWFVCFDPLLSTACSLEDLPRITYTMKSSLRHSLDSDQRLLRDEVCWGLLRLLPFNYLFWHPAFECRSLRLNEFLRRLFDFSLSWTKNDCMLGRKEQT